MIPGGFPVRLHEVGITTGSRAHRVEGVGRPSRALTFGWSKQCAFYPGRVQSVDAHITEKPLRVRLRRREHARQMRQAGTNDHEWRTRLRQLVAACAERRNVLWSEILHLVD